jgi:hypothetical protein
MTEKRQKMTMLREKCDFCNPQNCHFVCHFFVIWWKILSFFVIWVPFSKKYGAYRKLLEK